jgi:hypothetical protein
MDRAVNGFAAETIVSRAHELWHGSRWKESAWLKISARMPIAPHLSL